MFVTLYSPVFLEPQDFQLPPQRGTSMTETAYWQPESRGRRSPVEVCDGKDTTTIIKPENSGVVMLVCKSKPLS
jgi:hypothetical protein